MSEVIEIGSNEEFEKLIKGGKVLVDFFAVWCGPCQAMKPILEGYAKDNMAVKVAAVDVDKMGEIATKYQVMSIPTFVIFVNGEVKAQKTGAMSADDLAKWVEKTN